MSKGKYNKHPELLLATTLASAAVGSGHVCWPLAEKTSLPGVLSPALLPEPKDWRQSLLKTGVVGQPGDIAPLILDQQNRLYLYRLHTCEELIAQELLQRAKATSPTDAQAARPLLERLFPKQSSSPDLQQLAAAMALLKPLLVISGGPGTGKTYTIARILALLQALHTGPRPLRIALAAPTGKAAARLEESIRAARQTLPDELGRHVPEKAQTLHRLLGARSNEEEFRHNRDNPLDLDLLAVDEASMIDVMLMAALLEALPSKARLILLGDRSQLASVEAGSLFADLCGSGEATWSPQLCENLQQFTGTVPPPASQSRPMDDSCILLRTGHRFHAGSGIGSLATVVNSGSLEKVTQVLATGFADLEIAHWIGKERETWLREQILGGFREMAGAATLEQGFVAMEQFRFLCAVHKGPSGTEEVNRLSAEVLRRARLISWDGEWYQGRPLIILCNNYDLKLFNGDTGLLWRDRDGKLKAWFRRPDGQLHPVSPALLPEHETAYAVTVHKAQGSEFEQVLLLLPEEESRVLSRELLYTGITRAKSKLILCADQETLATAVRSRTRRYSGLGEKLHGITKEAVSATYDT